MSLMAGGPGKGVVAYREGVGLRDQMGPMRHMGPM
jgi:hypothetical protein